jgi:hypothetical protein
MKSDGSGELTPIAHFIANAAGAAIVDAVSQLREPLTTAAGAERRYLVIAPDDHGKIGSAVQVSL